MKEYSVGDIVTDGEMFDALEKLSDGFLTIIKIPISRDVQKFDFSDPENESIYTSHTTYAEWTRKVNGYFTYWERTT